MVGSSPATPPTYRAIRAEEQQMSNFDEIESLLSRLLMAEAPVLSDAERAEVQRFIDVGEYGLDLETAAAIDSEEKKIATAGMEDLTQREASARCMELAPFSERLPKTLSD